MTTTSRKRKIRTVSLRFFEDNANGEWGLTHDNTQGSLNNYGEGFNAFWDGRGIFHDLFEHAHEFTKYFSGEAAMNVGGEVAAMGAMWYYYRHGMWSRLDNPYFGYQTQPAHAVTIRGTCDMMQEAITDLRTEYGNTLVSHVPNQSPVDDSELEEIIAEHLRLILATEPGKSLHDSEQDRLPDCEAYKASVTFRKLANLYRYGYRMGRRLFKDEKANGDIAQEFVEYWNAFCKANNAEELAMSFRGITFILYRDHENLIHWKARFEPQPGSGIEAVILRGGPEGVPSYFYIT